MLGLSQEIRTNSGRVSRVVTDHKHLTWPRKHVNRSSSLRHQALGSRNPLIAGPHDNVALWHRPDALRQRGDGLRPPHPEHPVRLGHVRGRHRDLVGVGARHPHLLDAGGARGASRHKNRRREGVPPPRRVAPGSLYRRHRLPRLPPRDVGGRVLDAPPLRRGELADALRHASEDALLVLGEAVEGSLQLGGRACVRLPLLDVFELCGSRLQRLLPPLPDAVDDGTRLLQRLGVDRL
mmetsp:Transcript_922/g.2126  ORF Transcript_922/g.2126 Transcript_922/m.2126 type:complete len:237 (-) Transcript_922:175-885(-)